MSWWPFSEERAGDAWFWAWARGTFRFDSSDLEMMRRESAAEEAAMVAEEDERDLDGAVDEIGRL